MPAPETTIAKSESVALREKEKTIFAQPNKAEGSGGEPLQAHHALSGREVKGAEERADARGAHKKPQRVSPAVEDILRENRHQRRMLHADEAHQGKKQDAVADGQETEDVTVSLLEPFKGPACGGLLRSRLDLHGE